jgi:hypothetical protein
MSISYQDELSHSTGENDSDCCRCSGNEVCGCDCHYREPEPLEEESFMERDIRLGTLRSFAAEQQRLADAIDLATALLAPHMKEPN